MQLLAVYGTLRRNQPFYKMLKAPEFVRTTRLEGFILWDLGKCPTASKTRDNNDTIQADIIALNERDWDIVMRVETAANYWLYYTRNQSKLENNNLAMWIDKDPKYLHEHGYPIIKSGDWVKHISTYA